MRQDTVHAGVFLATWKGVNLLGMCPAPACCSEAAGLRCAQSVKCLLLFSPCSLCAADTSTAPSLRTHWEGQAGECSPVSWNQSLCCLAARLGAGHWPSSGNDQVISTLNSPSPSPPWSWLSRKGYLMREKGYQQVTADHRSHRTQLRTWLLPCSLSEQSTVSGLLPTGQDHQSLCKCPIPP